MSRRSAILPLLVLAAALSCESATRPPDVVAVYALAMVGGVAVPAAPFGGASWIVMADTFSLREDGTGARAMVVRDTGSLVTDQFRAELTWRANLDTLHVDLVCPRNAAALCLASPHFIGHITPGMQWVLDHAINYELPAAFDRVGAR